MSAHNGDKARHHKQRKRRIARRMKIRDLKKSLEEQKKTEQA
jgi:hypothetical protein